MLLRLDEERRRARLLYFLPDASASMRMSYVLSGIAIVICAGVGATTAWLIVSSMGWDGVGGAIATTIVAMVLATLLFAVGVVLGKALGLLR